MGHDRTRRNRHKSERISPVHTTSCMDINKDYFLPSVSKGSQTFHEPPTLIKLIGDESFFLLFFNVHSNSMIKTSSPFLISRKENGDKVSLLLTDFRRPSKSLRLSKYMLTLRSVPYLSASFLSPFCSASVYLMKTYKGVPDATSSGFAGVSSVAAAEACVQAPATSAPIRTLR